MWPPPPGLSETSLVHVVPPDLARVLHQRRGKHSRCESGHLHCPWTAARDGDVGQATGRPHHRAATPRGLWTVALPSAPPVGRRGTEYAYDEHALHKVTKHHKWLQAQNYWFVPVAAATTGELHPECLRLLYDFPRLKTDAAGQHAVVSSLRSPLAPEQLCQRRGATFARLRMEAQLYCLRASATRLTGKHWAAPYASSLLARSRSRVRCGVGAFAPAPTAHVLASH